METKKQEAIRKAWLYWLSEEDFEKLALDEDGFSNYQCRRYINQFRWNELYSRFRRTGAPKNGSDIIYRPKSLAGIENNNGWIAINCSDKPIKVDNGYYFIRTELNGIDNVFTYKVIDGFIRYVYATHYQPIIKPLPPIY